MRVGERAALRSEILYVCTRPHRVGYGVGWSASLDDRLEKCPKQKWKKLDNKLEECPNKRVETVP